MSGIRTYREGEVPRLRHTKVTWPERFNVPGEEAEQECVKNEHPKHMCQGEVVVR